MINTISLNNFDYDKQGGLPSAGSDPSIDDFAALLSAPLLVPPPGTTLFSVQPSVPTKSAVPPQINVESTLFTAGPATSVSGPSPTATDAEGQKAAAVELKPVLPQTAVDMVDPTGAKPRIKVPSPPPIGPGSNPKEDRFPAHAGHHQIPKPDPMPVLELPDSPPDPSQGVSTPPKSAGHLSGVVNKDAASRVMDILSENPSTTADAVVKSPPVASVIVPFQNQVNARVPIIATSSIDWFPGQSAKSRPAGFNILRDDVEVKSALSPETGLDRSLAVPPATVDTAQPDGRDTSLGKPALVLALDEPDINGLEAEQFFDAISQTGSKVEKTLNKLAETVALAKRVIEQLEPEMVRLALFSQKAGETKFMKMRLNPAELGGVEIIIERTTAGTINAHLKTEREATNQILTEGLANLRTSLEGTGSQVGEVKISFGSFSSREDAPQGNNSQQFGPSENRSGEFTNLDGISATEDDIQNRLVNLRA